MPDFGSQPRSRPPGNGMAVAGLVLGIIGIVFGVIPFTFLFAWVLGALAIVFGLVASSRASRDPDRGGRGMATAGWVTGIVAVVFGVGGLVILVTIADDLDEILDEIDGEADPSTYELTTGACTSRFGVVEFEGTIENTDDDGRNYSIEVVFTDADGLVVDTGSDLVTDLPPGRIARWSATGSVDDAADVVCAVSSIDNFFN